jgi:hypothetical protein
LDPRVHVSENDLASQLKLARQIDVTLDKSVKVYNTMTEMKKGNISAAMSDSISTLTSKGHPNLSSAIGALSSLVSSVQSADSKPTQGEEDVYSFYKKQVEGLLTRWQKIERK